MGTTDIVGLTILAFAIGAALGYYIVSFFFVA
jgi:hypothetical protein